MDSMYAGPDQGQVLGESNDSLKDDKASWGQQVRAWLLPYSPLVFRVQYKVRDRYPLQDVILGWDSLKEENVIRVYNVTCVWTLPCPINQGQEASQRALWKFSPKFPVLMNQGTGIWRHGLDNHFLKHYLNLEV